MLTFLNKIITRISSFSVAESIQFIIALLSFSYAFFATGAYEEIIKYINKK